MFRLVHAPQNIEVSCHRCIARELFLSSSFRQVFGPFKLNQMSPVVVLVHVARLSQRKVLLLLRYGVVDLLVLGGVRGAFWLYVWLRLTTFLSLRNFLISLSGKSFYDFGSWWWLLIRDNQLTLGTFVKVVVLGLAFRNQSETNKKGD